MSKIIFIGKGRNGHTSKANFKLFMFTGLLFLVNGSFLIYNNVVDPVGLIIGILTILGAIYYIMYGYFTFSEKSKWAPKVIIENDHIQIKKKMFKPAATIVWERINKIIFGAYEITFDIEGKSDVLNYDTSSEVSIELKEAIREAADEKGIEVVGG